MNSPSKPHTSSKGRSSLVTCGPSQEEGMLWAIDQSAFISEGEPEDFGVLELGPDGIIEAALGRRKNHIAAVFLVGVEPHPLALACQEANLFGAVILVLISLRVGVTDGNDAG